MPGHTEPTGTSVRPAFPWARGSVARVPSQPLEAQATIGSARQLLVLLRPAQQQEQLTSLSSSAQIHILLLGGETLLRKAIHLLRRGGAMQRRGLLGVARALPSLACCQRRFRVGLLFSSSTKRWSVWISRGQCSLSSVLLHGGQPCRNAAP